MRTPKLYILITLILPLICSSCSAPGSLIAREEPNQIPSIVETPEAGMYALFVVGDQNPMFSFRLNKSERIGFEQAPAGVVGELRVDMVYAVAGQNRFPLEITRSYEWRKL